jgi:glycerol-3-phosphate dehydrogenase (NAD(P)+)
MKHPLKIVVMGAGAWGTSLANLASQNGHVVNLWSRRCSQSLELAVAGADLVVSAIAMQGVRETTETLKAIALPSHVILLTATKGLDIATQSLDSSSDPAAAAHHLTQRVCTPSQIWQQAFPTHPVIVLSGPNLSAEITQGLPAASVVASTDLAAAKVAQLIFSSSSFRVYTNPDPLGVELGGTLKNVIAIAAGACDGLKLGTNAKAALVTRGLAEMIRIGSSYWGAKVETFYGLSGLGDLLATCNSSLSRNYQVGYHLAQGKIVSEILEQLQGTAEGVNTSKVLMELTPQPDVVVPISYQVVRLLKQEITPQAAVSALMLRDIKPEYES